MTFETPWHEADVAMARLRRPAALMVPKAQDAGRLQALHEATGLLLVALVETAAGLTNVRAIAASPGVVRLAFGSIDFCAELGCAHTRLALLSARSEIVLASRLAGLSAPLDGVTTSIQDMALITDDARHAAELGFSGKLCIHPAQIAAAREGFRPTAEQFAWAERILTSRGGAQAIDGEMVDEPVKRRAEHILSIK